MTPLAPNPVVLAQYRYEKGRLLLGKVRTGGGGEGAATTSRPFVGGRIAQKKLVIFREKGCNYQHSLAKSLRQTQHHFFFASFV